MALSSKIENPRRWFEAYWSWDADVEVFGPIGTTLVRAAGRCEGRSARVAMVAIASRQLQTGRSSQHPFAKLRSRFGDAATGPADPHHVFESAVARTSC